MLLWTSSTSLSKGSGTKGEGRSGQSKCAAVAKITEVGGMGVGARARGKEQWTYLINADA